ncbi:tectonic-1 isoform X2 [Ascaphus truei]|uniref:tectonic-1 isoform X2 n=1 Tax=Ascaphus truei TaxID=8439 RepID=UPI003F5A47D0
MLSVWRCVILCGVFLQARVVYVTGTDSSATAGPEETPQPAPTDTEAWEGPAGNTETPGSSPPHTGRGPNETPGSSPPHTGRGPNETPSSSPPHTGRGPNETTGSSPPHTGRGPNETTGSSPPPTGTEPETPGSSPPHTGAEPNEIPGSFPPHTGTRPETPGSSPPPTGTWPETPGSSPPHTGAEPNETSGSSPPHTGTEPNETTGSVLLNTDSPAISPLYIETRPVTPDLGSPVTAPSVPPAGHVVTQPPITVEDPGASVISRALAFPSPVTTVASLCVCDLSVAQCDSNCCCDPDCDASDFSVFSGCSVPIVRGDSQLCTQEAVLYSINSSSKVPERVVQPVELISPSVFCIEATNYQPGLSFISPDVPTESNFDRLLKEFGGNSFNTEIEAQNAVGPSVARNATKYEYGSPILTADTSLKLPAPLGASACTDTNPVGFLMNQDLKCTRDIQIESCSIPALTLGTYTSVRVLAIPNSRNLVNITVQSITVTSLNGTRAPGSLSDGTPVWDSGAGVCTGVVLEGSYLITYTDRGEITHVSAAFILGAVTSAMLPLPQNFRIHFTQEGTAASPLSGNPGYVVGLPLVAGFKLPQSGIIHSTNRFGQLTLLTSSTNQDCLAEEGNRAAVVFGYNTVSGCKLRYSAATICPLAAEIALNALKGRQFPEYVASFGNSQPQNVLDWVPITLGAMCRIPVSLELEVRWTKYGSLVNPQAKIVNVTQKITHALIPANSGRTLPISASVAFVDVSAPAQAGYKAPPTIDAKLPFDFFYPFV